MSRKLSICLMCLLMCQMAYGQESIRVVVFPFQMNTLESSDFLQRKIQDLLVSNLENSTGVSVVIAPFDEPEVMEGLDATISEASAKKIGIEAAADFAVMGSFTKIGESSSLDAQLIQIKGQRTPTRMYSYSKNSKEVSSQVIELTRLIHARLSGEDVIVKISVQGNNGIETDAIFSQIKSREGDVLSPKALRSDLKDIYNMGYFEDVKITSENMAGGKEITFVVYEKPSIKAIEINGNKFVKKKAIKESIDIKVHTILDLNKIEESLNAIVKLYKGKGYWSVEVDYKVYYLKTNEAVVDFGIKENEKVKIRKIRFEGNKAYGDGKLRDIIKTSTKGFFPWFTSSGVLKEDVLEQDIDRISSFYSNNGYIDVKVGKPEIHYDTKNISIAIPINEGEQFQVGKIDIEGDLIEEKAELLKKLNITQGKRFSRKLLRKDIAHLTEKYTEAGYAFAEVTPLTSIDRMNKSVGLTFNVRKGKKVHFERITIAGNDRTRDKVIRRELKVAEGDLYSKKKLAKSYEKVYRLGYFEEVGLNAERGSSDDTLDLYLRVKERPTGSISLGAGYSSIDKLVAMANVSQNNFRGKGQKLAVSGRLGGRSQNYNIGFTEPWLFDKHVSAGFDFYDIEREYTDYTKQAQGGDIRFGFPITEDYTRTYLTYKREGIDLTDVSATAADIIKDQEGSSVTSGITTSLVRDARNSFIFPTDGSRNSITIEYAGGFLGGTNFFTKYIANTTQYFPLFRGTVFMFHGTAGYARGNKGRELPLFERFYLGGINSVRGFETFSIGPKDSATGDIIGGNKELLFNFEYIFPLLKGAGIQGVIFFDAGNAFNNDEDYSLKALRTSVGSGIRWYSPMGPLRLEWGYNLDPEPDEKQSNWDFTIGTTF